MKNLTRSLMTVAVILALIVSATITLALPKIDVYRYRGTDIKTLPGDLILGNVTTVDSWIKDDNRWPKDKKILLLVHGLPMLDNGKNRYGLNGLAIHYSQERKINDVTLPAYDAIYAVEYLMGFSVFETTASLFQIISDKTVEFSETQKFDIFAHSLGGLPVRAYLEFPGENKVSHAVFMGTPHNGVDTDELRFFRENYDFLPVEVNDLNPESIFLTSLNLGLILEGKKVNSDYYSIVGLRSWAPEQFGKSFAGPLAKVLKSIQDKNYPVHDGLISSESAGYDLSKYCRSFKLITLNLNHEYIKSDPSVYAAIDKWMIDDKWFPTPVVVAVPPPQNQTYTGGLPFMLGKSHAQIIELFRNGNLTYFPSDYPEDPVGSKRDYNKAIEFFYGKENFGDIDFYPVAFFLPYPVSQPTSRGLLKDVKNEVQAFVYNNPSKYNLGKINRVTVRDIVPKEILESPPTEICWVDGNYYDNQYSLVVIWKYFGDTFVLNVKDDRYNIIDLIKTKDANRYTLKVKVQKNDNTMKFADANNVLSFSQIRGDIDLFGRLYNMASTFQVPKMEKKPDCGVVDPGTNFRLTFYRFK